MSGETINCGSQCAVTVQLAPAPPTAENLTDIGLVFSLFLGAAVVVFCARALLDLFRAPDEK
ncbi:hypothetical protein [Variovorax durovernensis]